ncbi:MAG: hypothetical protein E6G62_10675 [Actinobacteria bacterium]|nr:MAG: hypothetical protein E6G62_10675 [Actinomycetota bacterium]
MSGDVVAMMLPLVSVSVKLPLVSLIVNAPVTPLPVSVLLGVMSTSNTWSFGAAPPPYGCTPADALFVIACERNPGVRPAETAAASRAVCSCPATTCGHEFGFVEAHDPPVALKPVIVSVFRIVEFSSPPGSPTSASTCATPWLRVTT